MTVKPTIAKETLASAMPVIEQLLVDHLEEEPAGSFRDGIWKALLENKDVFEQQQARCAATFDKVDWKYESLAAALSDIRCSKCGSSLVRHIDPDNTSPEAMDLGVRRIVGS